jgi:hypothetical protein
MVRGGKHLDQGDELEEKGGDGRGNADLLPPGPVI